VPFEDGSQLAHSKSGRKQFVLAQFGLQVFRGDFRSLGSTRQRAGHEQIGSHLETREKFRHLAHFFFTEIGERALIIRFFPIRPVGLAITKAIKLHVVLISFCSCLYAYSCSYLRRARRARPTTLT